MALCVLSYGPVSKNTGRKMDMRALRELWVLAIGVFVGFFSVIWVAYGATYNFYFNNSEQGNNSTASPTVHVSDGKGETSGAPQAAAGPSPSPSQLPIVQASPAPTPEQAVPATATEAAPAAAALSSSSSARLAELEADEERRHVFRRVRLSGGGVLVSQSQNKIYNSSYYPSSSFGFHSQQYGAMGNLGVYLAKPLALNIFFGGYEQKGNGKAFAGADLEIIPLRVSIWRFTDLIEGGLLVGASSIRKSAYNLATAHVGARLSFNLGDQWTITAAGRGNQGYIMAEAGIGIRL